MKKILVILGQTATGKTDIALELAQQFNGELVACDSRQVYKGLDIGTGKMPGGKVPFKKNERFWEIDGVKVWMYDVADPGSQFTVKDYVRLATKVVTEVGKRDKLPIVVGGTGLYLKALLFGLSNLEVPVDPLLREELQRLSLNELQARLQSVSISKWQSLNESDRQNSRRLIRAIELILSGTPISSGKGLAEDYHLLIIGLSAPRENIYQRIDKRLIKRTEEGLIEEGQELMHQGLTTERMKELGLEYGVLADYFEGKITKEQFIPLLSTRIHQYAKRQETWFKREKDIHWLDITDPEFRQKMEKLVSSWYHSSNDKKD